MYDKGLKELETISQAVGIHVDMVQAGGGNTSVKLDDKLMAVKASGFRLSQISPAEGYVVVDYQKIKNYFETVDLNQDKDYEKESVDFVKASIVPFRDMKPLRPSVEAGFHSILKKYVIHTHPVYANVVCCSQSGSELVRKIFKGKNYDCIWIPYINPGFCLTLSIQDEIKKSLAVKGKFPEVIFMENHGLVATSDSVERCTSLHDDVNSTIKEYLKITEKFPEIVLEDAAGDTIISKTTFISDYFRNNMVDGSYFDINALYPDQLVYLNGNAGTSKEYKLEINPATGAVTYHTTPVEARTMEETLLGYLYVLKTIHDKKLPLKTMSEKDILFIKNWESESYRKSLVKELKQKNR